MPFPSKISKEELAQAIEWAKEGISQQEILKSLGNCITRQRLSQILKENHVKATEIKKSKAAQEEDKKMTAKWGPQWADKEWRRSALYDAMREKFRGKKAKTYGWEWSIEFGDLEWPTVCPVLGIPLDYFQVGRQENSVSFDRTDSTKGYVKGNVTIMSWRANRIKNDGTLEEHKKIVAYLQHLETKCK